MQYVYIFINHVFKIALSPPARLEQFVQDLQQIPSPGHISNGRRVSITMRVGIGSLAAWPSGRPDVELSSRVAIRLWP